MNRSAIPSARMQVAELTELSAVAASRAGEKQTSDDTAIIRDLYERAVRIGLPVESCRPSFGSNTLAKGVIPAEQWSGSDARRVAIAIEKAADLALRVAAGIAAGGVEPLFVEDRLQEFYR